MKVEDCKGCEFFSSMGCTLDYEHPYPIELIENCSEVESPPRVN